MRCCTVAVLLGSFGAGCSGSGSKKSPPAAEVARIDALAEEMRAVARAADAKRTKALLAAATELAPRADLGRCPIAVPVVGTEDMSRLGEGEPRDAPVNWRSIRANQMMVVKAEELATAKSARLADAEKMIEYSRSGLNESNVADTEKWIRHYSDPTTAPWEMVIVATQRVDPEPMDGDKFRGGVIVGRAFVYDHPTGTVVCAGDVAAGSSELLTMRNDQPAAVAAYVFKQDLENEAYREAAKALVMAGPKDQDKARARPAPAAETGSSGNAK